MAKAPETVTIPPVAPPVGAPAVVPPVTPPAASTLPTNARATSVVTAIATDIPLPVKESKRGSSSVYPFDQLPVNGSFGVVGKTAKQLQGIVTLANRKAWETKTDDQGKPVMKTTTATAGDGTTVLVPTDKPETVQTRHYVVKNVDPATDPAGASARIWRDL